MAKTPAKSGKIHVGIGGWTFAPWRGVFYPEKLTQAKELSYAAGKLTGIEINGTYYGSQKPETFRKWASEVPDGFVLFGQGSAFRNQSQGAGRGRRVDHAILRFWRH